MAHFKLSQKEYLKKYLSSGNDLKKKKKKKLIVGIKTVKIIDDDVDIKSMRPFEDGEFDILNSTEDAPQIVGVIDERGPVDFADKRRWKIIADDGDGNISISDNQNMRNDKVYKQMANIEKELVKNSKINEKNVNNQPFSKTFDIDLSPPRNSRSKKKKKNTRRKSHSTCSSSSSGSENISKKKYKPSNHPKSNGRGTDSDLSPPRQSISQSNNSDPDTFKKLAKKNTRKRRESDSDLSPPRYSREDNKYINTNPRQKRGSSSDLSPPRKNRKDRQKLRGSDSDLSPPRNRDVQHSRDSRNDDNNTRSESTKRRKSSRWNNEQRSPSPHSDKRMKKTLDGKTAGLQNAKELKSETTSYKQRETELFKKMSVDVSGIGQAPVVRDRKTGRRRDLEAEALENMKKKERQMEIDEKYAKWGRGLKQIADRNEKLQQDAYEMTKAVARHADDVDLNNEQRNALHAEDPMLEYIKAKQIKEGKRQPDKPSFQGSYMPNRFGIRPGCRWDGVDRSNGYEKRWFEAQNARTAVEEQAYKWSTSDM